MDAQGKQSNQARPGSSAAGTIRSDGRDAQAEDAPAEYAEEYPAYRSLLQDLPAVPSYDLSEDTLSHMPAGSKDSGWQNCLNSVEKYDRVLCQAYREQIDTLLVFAGLFSAVVTAFAVESYQWLQDDPVDTSVDLLRDVVGLLARNSNVTAPLRPASPQRLSGAAIVRINAFWFVSLTLSLSAALVGILCKQWLREFEHSVGQSPETALAVRHIRFQGFEYWKVGSIVTSVPIILQIALASFIIGVTELLWRLHTIIACCVTVVAALTLAFYLATTLLPVVQYAYICLRCCVKPLRTRYYPARQAYTEPQCAFKSAQAWLAFCLAQPILDRILKAYGYQFSSSRPPALYEHILRPANSWVDFDLNWVKCREDIHVGPRCAFEGLTWIARNLGEMHMSSWIWHCVWARWLKNRESNRGITIATREIESVARSYRQIVPLSSDNPPLARSQALVFQCSLRTDLPINTAVELLLRVTAVAGASSEWTQEALYAVRVVYHDQPIHLSDELATALFRMAELQTHAILFGIEGPNSASQSNAALGFREIFIILHRGARLRDIFVPAMCGHVLKWLRSRPSTPVARAAVLVFQHMILFLVSRGYRGPALRDLRQCNGIMFIAKMAHAVTESWPDYVRNVFEPHPVEQAVIRELLAICSEGFPELAQDHMGGRPAQSSGPVGAADVEGSSESPTPDTCVTAQTAAEAHSDKSAYVTNNVHGEEGTDAIDDGVNCPGSPGGCQFRQPSFAIA